MTLQAQVKKIRRYLRDPDGNVWSREFINNLYNDAQKDLQQQTQYLEEIAVVSLPPRYQYSYMYDWEWAFLPSGESYFYQCLKYQDLGDFVYCHEWETQENFGVSGDVGDIGTQCTHPWEAWYTSPGFLIKNKLPDNFGRMRMIAYDRQPIFYTTLKEVTERDQSYITHEGDPVAYYRDDDLENSFILYPRPSSVVWNDVTDEEEAEYVYSQDWESSYLSGTGARFTKEGTDYNYVFAWELDLGTDIDVPYRAMFLFELGYAPGGGIQYVTGETTDALGVLSSRTGTLFNQESGIAIDIIDDSDNLTMIYLADPVDVSLDADVPDFPKFMRKYINFHVISSAYGANTDGRISSLADYWNLRYKTGIEMIRRHKGKRKQDRDYALVTPSVPSRRTVRHPRLPSTYPAI